MPITHPVAGTRVGLGLPFQLSKVTPDHHGAPVLGQDNEYVCCELLGMSNDEFTRLQHDGIIL